MIAPPVRSHCAPACPFVLVSFFRLDRAASPCRAVSSVRSADAIIGRFSTMSHALTSSFLFLASAFAGFSLFGAANAAPASSDKATLPKCCVEQRACCSPESDCCPTEAQAAAAVEMPACCVAEAACCADGAACCQPGGDCCVEGAPCCTEGAACCEPAAACCAADAACCVADAACCNECPTDK